MEKLKETYAENPNETTGQRHIQLQKQIKQTERGHQKQNTEQEIQINIQGQHNEQSKDRGRNEKGQTNT